MPLRFEEDAGNALCPDSRFVARGIDYGLCLSSGGITLLLPSSSPASSKSGVAPDRGAVLRMFFPGANPRARLQAEEELEARSNYYYGNDSSRWRVGVKAYARVRYLDIYPGIDLLFYGNQGNVEYDFIVKPGADPEVIRIRYEGADPVLNSGGDLVLKTDVGDVVQRAPLIYQESGDKTIKVAGAVAPLGDGRFGFHVEGYDEMKTLVIDPGIEFSTLIGGRGDEEGHAIAYDSSGNLYVAGITSSNNFPVTSGALDSSHNGGNDVVVLKLDFYGSRLLYATYLGGIGDEEGRGIAVDSSGAVYVTGNTSSTAFPVTSGAFSTVHNGAYDAFVFKIAANGALVYSTFLGGAGNDFGYGIKVDSTGSAYVVGGTTSGGFPVTPDVFDMSHNGGNDAFVSKLNPSGSALAYSTFIGGSGADYASALVLDSSGAAYVVGVTASSDFPTVTGSYDTSYNGSNDVFVCKLKATGSGLAFSTFIGGNGIDEGNALYLDSSGAIYVTGKTSSSDFPTSSGVITPTYAGNTDAFVTQLNSAGSGIVFSTYLGGTNFDAGYGIFVNLSGVVIVAGVTNSINFPTVPGAENFSPIGGYDVFVATISATGNTLPYATYMGGGGTDYPLSMVGDDGGYVYVSGYTASADFQATSTAYSTKLAGGNDIFVFKLDPAAASTEKLDVNFNSALKVVGSYWQASSAIYTMVAVSHPNLAGMSSTIGVKMLAVENDGSLFGSTSFTVGSGKTRRAFITTKTNQQITTSNLPNENLILGRDTLKVGGRTGMLIFKPIATNPYSVVDGGFRDITLLSFWGAVVLQGMQTGFTMEYVGDLHDSIDNGSGRISGTSGGGFVQGGVGPN